MTRGNPLPDLQGSDLIQLLLAEIDEEEELSRAVGMDLTPPSPSADHAPREYGPLSSWLARSEEVHELRQAVWRAEHAEHRR
jgi:hypothetical protein